jgi:hypothetical protein
MKNNVEVKIQLGGEERILLFGPNGVNEYIEEASGEEPFEWQRRMLTSLQSLAKGEGVKYDTYRQVKILVFAGLNMYYDYHNMDNVQWSVVKKWANSLSEEELGQVLRDFISTIIKGETEAPANGAVKKDETLTVVAEPGVS